MRLSTFKNKLATLLLILVAIGAEGATADSADSSEVDSTVAITQYDKRIHRYRRHWNSLIPTQQILQFYGNMGLVSAGIGWDYGKRGQWETQLLFGIVPKYDSHNTKLTMTIKQNFIPWSMCLRTGLSFEPLQCGIYINTVFGHDFWVKQPTKYGSGYYPVSTKLRPNIFIGERITKTIPNNRHKYVKSVSLFYELSTNDIYIIRLVRTGAISFWDFFGLSFGIKAQLL